MLIILPYFSAPGKSLEFLFIPLDIVTVGSMGWLNRVCMVNATYLDYFDGVSMLHSYLGLVTLV